MRITGREMDLISRNERRTPSAHETGAFMLYLHDEYGTSELPDGVDAALFGKAYEMGHSAGYSEIELMYGELADLVLLAYRAH